MPKDLKGVHKYAETDNPPKFSELMNLGMDSVSDAIVYLEGTPAEGKTASHEAIYQYIYAMPRGELARHGIFLRRKQTRRRPRKAAGRRGAPILGMVSIDERDPDAADRRVPGHWESQ